MRPTASLPAPGALGAFVPLLRIWAPAALSNSILTLEIPVVAALVARGRDGTASLAAFGAVLTVIMLVNTPAMPLASTTAVLGRDRAAFRRVQIAALGLGALTSLVLLVILLTPLAMGLLVDLVGLSRHVAELTVTGLVALVPAPLAVSWRRCCQGLLIALGRTAGMAYASTGRIVTSVAAAGICLAATPLPATAAGAVALTSGAAAEAVIVTVWARRNVRSLPASAARPPSQGAIARFHAPLAATYALAMLPQGLITAGIARGLDSEASLAAWPVLYGFTWLLAGLAIEMESITASFGRSGAGAAVQPFVWILGSVLSATALLAAVPALGRLYFADLSGLAGHPASLAVGAVPLVTVVPLLVTLRAWLRGRLLAAGSSLRIQLAMLAGLLVLVVLLMGGSRLPSVAGLYIGALALTLYLGAEVLGLRVLLAGRGAAPAGAVGARR